MSVQKDINAENETAASRDNKYFSNVSNGYFKASKVFLLMTAAFFLITLLFNSKVLTYNNFNYLMRDINSAASLASGNYSSISYKNDEVRITKNFRGGIITVSSTDMAIYNATGRRTFFANENMVSPNIAVSKKYAVVYELGGNKYRVYNSFAKISEGSFKYPISGAAVSDSGWFSVMSRDNEHNSVVYLYDDDCQLRNTYSFATKYVFSVAINKNGNRIAIILTEADGEKFSTSVMICEPGKKDKRAEVKVSEGLPYGCTFTEDNDIQLICSDGVFLLDPNGGTEKNSYDLEDSNISRVSMTEKGCALSVTSGVGITNNEVFVFDKKGNMIYNTIVESSMIDMEYDNGYVFINQSSSIMKINIKKDDKKTYKIIDDGKEIIIYDSGNILLCCPTKAMYIKV